MKKARQLYLGSETTVVQAQSLVKESLRQNKPVICPCCMQVAQLKDYHLTVEMVKVMVILHRGDKGFIDVGPHLEEVNKLGANIRSRNWARLTVWGMLEANDKKQYRLTEQGRKFVLVEISAPLTIQMYNGKFIRFGSEWGMIKDVLGEEIDYDQLMSGNYGAFVV